MKSSVKKIDAMVQTEAIIDKFDPVSVKNIKYITEFLTPLGKWLQPLNDTKLKGIEVIKNKQIIKIDSLKSFFTFGNTDDITFFQLIGDYDNFYSFQCIQCQTIKKNDFLNSIGGFYDTKRISDLFKGNALLDNNQKFDFDFTRMVVLLSTKNYVFPPGGDESYDEAELLKNILPIRAVTSNPIHISFLEFIFKPLCLNLNKEIEQKNISKLFTTYFNQHKITIPIQIISANDYKIICNIN